MSAFSTSGTPALAGSYIEGSIVRTPLHMLSDGHGDVSRLMSACDRSARQHEVSPAH